MSMSGTRKELERIAEEIANSVTHGVGLGLSLAGFIVLIILAGKQTDTLHKLSILVYGATLVILYAASTIYHSVHHVRLKRVFRVVDHAAIYLLIAGTYTPFLLIYLRGSAWGWVFLASIWTMTLFGIVYKIFFIQRFPGISTATYLAMGWMAVLFIRPIVRAIPSTGLLWLAAGGLLYTAGVWFYTRDHQPYRHAIWHLFVLGGSACHYVAVLVSLAAPELAAA